MLGHIVHSLDMIPAPPYCNVADRPRRHAISLAKLHLGNLPQQLSNLANLLLCQDSGRVLRTNGIIAMLTAMLLVLLFGYPSKVAQPIVSRVTVKVARLFTLWARADKSLKDHPVNRERLLFTTPCKSRL